MDLTTRYLGLSLKNPLIASASPLNGDIGNLRGLEDAGAAAVVLPSIFEEQIVGERRGVQAGRAADIDPESYLDLIRRAKEALDIPVIASLNGVSRTRWVDFGRMLQHAGADAIELNIYFIAADLLMTGREVDERYVDVLAAVKSAVTIPVAVKIGPYFSAVGALARALAAAGAAGLVLFNRFYQPDIDIRNLELAMELELSTPSEIRLPLLWIALLHGRVPMSIAASTGVETAEQVFKYLLVGADVVMTTSSLLRHGITHMKTLLEGLAATLAAREVASLNDIRGRMSQHNVEHPTAFQRANYINLLQSYHVGVIDDPFRQTEKEQ
jgi:dihydroorotate dehydrogenase (fumarate)